MSGAVALSKVEQALVHEVVEWVKRSTAEVQAVADAKLACVLEAHGLAGREATFARREEGWVLVVEGAASVAPGADEPPINDQ